MPERFGWGKTSEELAAIEAQNEQNRADNAQGRAMEAGRMDSDEAHEEANMLRVQAGVSPEHGRIGDHKQIEQKVGSPSGPVIDKKSEYVLRKTTPEDYNKALKSIEELKELVSKEPAVEKVLVELGRLTEKTRFVLMNVLRLPITALEAMASDYSSDAGEGRHEKIMNWLTDASHQLEDLKKKGDEFALNEKNYRNKGEIWRDMPDDYRNFEEVKLKK